MTLPPDRSEDVAFDPTGTEELPASADSALAEELVGAVSDLMRNVRSHSRPDSERFELAASIDLGSLRQGHFRIEPVWLSKDNGVVRVLPPTVRTADRIGIEESYVSDVLANDFDQALKGNVSITRASRTGDFATERLLSALPIVWGRSTERWSFGSPREGRLGWILNEDGSAYRLSISVDGEGIQVLKACEPWYVDYPSRMVGRVDGLDGFATLMWEMPPIPMAVAERVFAAAAAASGGRIPPPEHVGLTVLEGIEPTIRAQFYLVRQSKTAQARGIPDIPCMEASLRYDTWEVGAGDEDIFLTSDDGKALKIIRNRTTENRLQAAVKQLGLQPLQASGLSVPRSAQRVERLWVYETSDNELADSRRWAMVMHTMAARGALVEVGPDFPVTQIEARGHWSARSSFDGRKWLDILCDIEVDGVEHPGATALRDLAEDRSWISEGNPKDVRLVPLGKGRFVEFSLGDLREIIGPLMDCLGGVNESGAIRMHKSEVLKADKSRVAWSGKQRDLERLQRNLREIPMVLMHRDPELPFRVYQYNTAEWMEIRRLTSGGALVAICCGGGKTAIVALHLTYLKFNRLTDRPTLFVQLASNIGNTVRELAKWGPSLRVLVISGSDRAGQYEKLDGYDVVLMTYQVAFRDAAIHLSKRRFSVGVFDEISLLKNPTGPMRTVLSQLDIDFRVGLTGTPIENRLDDSWAMLDFLESGCLGTLRSFIKSYSTPAAFSQVARPRMLRLTREDIGLELPEHRETIRYVTLGDQQRLRYDTLKAWVRVQLERLRDEGVVLRTNTKAMEWINWLRWMATDPDLVRDKLRAVAPECRSRCDSSKLDELYRLIGNMMLEQDGHRVVVVSQRTMMLDTIQKELKRKRIRFNRLDGEMSAAKRNEQLLSFRDDRDTPVFLLSMFAGSYGLNELTSADCMILMEPWWNPQVGYQASCRIDRPGKTRPTETISLIAEDTVDERILEINRHKAKLAEDFLQGVTGLGDLSGLTDSEIMGLVE